ncbi:MAG TPA: alpha/beta hydrolase [Kiritimatiellia bacterium]|nr:alpha/beta hydrolase [Kiritimatiellia bacterium]
MNMQSLLQGVVLVTTLSVASARGEPSWAAFVLRAEKEPKLVAKYAAVSTATYKSVAGTSLKLHVYQPTNLKPGETRPALVYYHGGGWLRGGPSVANPILIYLASRGVVGIDAQYRLLPGEGNGKASGPQDCLADAKSAMRWVRAHAAQYQIDPANILAGGSSAGGHLAAALATIPGYDDPADDLTVPVMPRAVLLLNPAFDLVTGWGTGRRHAQEAGLDPAAFSPAQRVTAELPPFLILSGSKDGVCPPGVCKNFVAAMQKLGNRAQFVEFPGEKHGFYNPKRNDGANFNRVVKEMDAFLQSIGVLSAPEGSGSW